MPKLGWHDPYGGPNHEPHKPMCEYLSRPRSEISGVSSTHFVGGRASAKTTAGQILVLRTAFVDMPGVPGFWSEPRHRDIERVFMRNWIANVPGHLWDYKKSDGKLIIHSNPITEIDLIARNVDNPGKKANLGSTYGWGIIDEAAVKFDIQRYTDLKASIRLNTAPYRFLDTLSTPQKNGYYNMCMRDDQHVIHSTSYDNPFIDNQTIDDIFQNCSDEYYQQEALGQWISQEGRMWEQFSEDDHPVGNMHAEGWDPSRPWFLGVDMGSALGHWQIWQYHDCPISSNVAVVVAEGLQKNEPIQVPLHLILDNYAIERPPVSVAIGHDVNTMGATGPEAELLIRQIGWRYQYPRGEFRYKSIQHQVLSGLILDRSGRRRFCISKKIKRHGPEKEQWGILHAMRNAQYPPVGSKDFFYKDKKEFGVSNTEDPIDSALYLAVINEPPRWRTTEFRAA